MEAVNDSPRVLGNRYEVGDLLGRGGMAEVHLGRDARLGRGVAIKLLRTDLARDPTFQARFRREAQSAAALNHPAIVAVYDTGEETVTESGGSVVSLPYIVMEHVQGRTLRDMLSDDHPLSVEAALEVTSGVLSALEYSHRSGIVHRDIKPANVMLTPSGDIKVMDFGIARALADASSGMTQTQAVIGTAQYLSPEQARGDTVDARSDLYSTGCLLFELLTGRTPFVADSPVAVAYQHVREQPQPPSVYNPAVPEDVDRIVLHALAKDREARYQTAAEFRADVEAARAGRRVAAPLAAGGATAMTEYIPEGGTAATEAMQPGVGTLLGTSGYGTEADPYSYNGQTATSRRDMRHADEPRNRWRSYTLLALIVALVLGLIGFGVYKALGTGGAKPPTTVAVPTTLVGASQELAEQRITDAGLTVGKVTKDASDTVEAGKVINTSPVPGAQVARGSAVDLVVSSGANTVEVPDVRGVDQTRARAALEAVGLSVGDVQTEDSAKDENTVIRTDPKAGQDVKRGSSVTLVVSSGEVNVPDVRGLPLDDARKKLTDLGMQPDSRAEISTAAPANTVIDQNPVNQKVKAGTVVQLIYAVPPSTPTTPPPTTQPNPQPTTQPPAQP
jgi:eukaryotic-like serine/threonine-protein kinase